MKRLFVAKSLKRWQLLSVLLALALVAVLLVAGYLRGQLVTTREDLKALGTFAEECAQSNPCWGH